MLVKKYFKGLVSAVFWLGIWWILSAVVGKEVLLPSPIQTVKALVSLASESSFWISCILTLVRISIGYAVGVITGTFIGALTYKSETADFLLRPLQSIVKSTPVASFIIISLVWLSKTQIPSFISSLIVIPIVWSNVNASLKSCDNKLLEAAAVFKLGFFKKVRYIYIPSIRKDYTAALETCLGIAWKSGVAAEVLALPRHSIGKELYNSKVYLESDKMFAWTFSIILISFALEFFLKRLITFLFLKKFKKVKKRRRFHENLA